MIEKFLWTKLLKPIVQATGLMQQIKKTCLFLGWDILKRWKLSRNFICIKSKTTIGKVSWYHVSIDTKIWCKRGVFKAWNSAVLKFFLSKLLVIFVVTKVSLLKLELWPIFLTAATWSWQAKAHFVENKDKWTK